MIKVCIVAKGDKIDSVIKLPAEQALNLAGMKYWSERYKRFYELMGPEFASVMPKIDLYPESYKIHEAFVVYYGKLK